MDKFPLCWKGKALGELMVEGDPLYRSFFAKCRLPWDGLWCIWLIGEQGELRLGIPEPGGEWVSISRRFSNRMTAPLGRLLRGELRPIPSGEGTKWKRAEGNLFRTPWLQKKLREMQGVLVRESKEGRFLAAPYDADRPFPLPPLLCFARIRQIEGRSYAVFAFDREEWPVFFE